MGFDRAPFVKMHGLGNDFVMLDLRDADPALRAAARRAEVAAALADRRRGVGCDQVVLVEPAERADARLTFLNADGSPSGACGNGTRCAAALLLGAGSGAIEFETGGGRLRAERRADGLIRVDMGAPRFDWRDIPLREPAPTDDLFAALGPIEGVRPRAIGAVSMGNPHCVLIVENVEAVDVAAVGAPLERHALFPERANVGFVEARAPDRLRVRVFERGVGITEACGSGACAALAVAHRLGFSGPAATLLLDGGALEVERDADSGHILMTGPTARVFEGRLSPELFAPELFAPELSEAGHG